VAYSAGGDGGVLVLRTGRQSLGILVMLTFTAVMDARVCLGGNDVFAGTVHGRGGGLPECIGCKRG
jgi:hypothetical protein